jgi:hypothetical protein
VSVVVSGIGIEGYDQKMSNDIKTEILVLLDRHPEGLTITDVAKSVGMHRLSITKYIYELTGEKKVIQRKVGPATLCYKCSKIYEKNLMKGQSSMALVLLIIPLALALILSSGIAFDLSGNLSVSAPLSAFSFDNAKVLLSGIFLTMVDSNG